MWVYFDFLMTSINGSGNIEAAKENVAISTHAQNIK